MFNVQFKKDILLWVKKHFNVNTGHLIVDRIVLNWGRIKGCLEYGAFNTCSTISALLRHCSHFVSKLFTSIIYNFEGFKFLLLY